MAAYQVGDIVEISKERPVRPQRGWSSHMDRWLGKTMTVSRVVRGMPRDYYKMKEDDGEWSWSDDMIGELEFNTTDSSIRDLLML